MAEFKKGDTVQLKSGGPIMTIQVIDDYSNFGFPEGAHCVWFDRDQQMDKVFDVAVLKHANDGEFRISTI